jgi:photosystem II stability/assembly factor-like uncharacterized protein
MIDRWCSTGLNIGHVTALAINQNGDLFAGTTGVPSPVKIFRSQDDGDHWELLDTGDTEGYTDVLAVHPNGDIYAATFHGMYSRLIYSTDNGDTWYDTNLRTGLTIRAIIFNSQGHVYICSIRHDESMGGVLYTTDRGVTWHQTNWSIYESAYTLLLISDDHFIATTDHQVFESIDNGYTWNEIYTSEESIGFYSLTKKEDDFIVASTYRNGLYFSTDCGRSWIQSSLNDFHFAPIAFDSTGNVYTADSRYDSNAKGIFYSQDDLFDWVEITYNLEGETITKIEISPTGTLFVGTWHKGVWKMVLPDGIAMDGLE